MIIPIMILIIIPMIIQIIMAGPLSTILWSGGKQFAFKRLNPRGSHHSYGDPGEELTERKYMYYFCWVELPTIEKLANNKKISDTELFYNYWFSIFTVDVLCLLEFSVQTIFGLKLTVDFSYCMLKKPKTISNSWFILEASCVSFWNVVCSAPIMIQRKMTIEIAEWRGIGLIF